MMKNSLGKLVIFLLFLPYILNAQVILQAPNKFYKNEVVVFSITAIGIDVKIPEIKKIDGNIVQNASTSQKTTIINGKRTYQLTKSYTIRASKDIKIPALTIMVDNKVEKTKAKMIKMLKVSKTKSDLYDLSIRIDKSEVYVGEAVEFTLKFKYKKDLDIVSLDYKKPDFQNFWVKELKPQQKQDNYTTYVEQEIKYLLFPQKSGKVELEPLKIGVTTVKNGYGGGFYLSTPTVTTPVYSNKLTLNVKALPNGVDLIGDFKINATVDKTTVNHGEAVSYKLFIEGRGNIDDLEEVRLNLPKSTIYDNPSKKEYNIQNNLYGGKYSKTYSIVSKDSFTIPSIKIRYFDKKSKQIKTIQTQSYDIKVKGVVQAPKKLEVAQVVHSNTNTLSNQQNQEVLTSSNKEKLIFFIIGLVSGLLIMFIVNSIRKKEKSKKESSLIKIVKQTKTPEQLFKVLVVYINIDEELDKIIYKLEKLSLSEYKIEKKNILKLLEALQKKDIKLDLPL